MACLQFVLGGDTQFCLNLGRTKYLVQFGYMDPHVMRNDSRMTNDMMESMMRTSIMDFQMFVGLQPTGMMDEETHEMMTKPRCGLKDRHDFDEEHSRRKRFSIFGGKWSKQNLTYAIQRYPSIKHLSRLAVADEMEKALGTWAAVAELNFLSVQRNETADIEIMFVSGSHGDEMPFDGVGKVLAHASSPTSGKVHFDDDEPWTIRKYTGQNMFYAAVHEFGHALGLGHSKNTTSVMFPYAGMYDPSFRLHSDDIQGIQDLYGQRIHFPPDICSDSTFDAIFQYPAGVTYVLKGEYYWKLAADGPLSGYPKLISHHWRELPGNIDAAIALPYGKIYFFKGNKTWAYRGVCLLPKYPRLISDAWRGIPNNVDAAMYYDNSTFFFFKGDHYWRYNSNHNHSVNAEMYPELLLKWDGIVGDLDDVLRIGNSVYFFRKGRYYRFNCLTRLVDRDYPNEPSYHRSTAYWWFRCAENDAELYQEDVAEPSSRNRNTGCHALTTLAVIFLISLSVGQVWHSAM
ncbi:matrix metalloproteinase-14-like [Zootermopsis nevadensis]|uniref:Matrix metalloproteinase-14 n=1 Tax=Zootermopsis nevadensis TaxID=136037 RepID=A0A067QV71_ZOONE|nr:matrix metalloproteinase-14-like [Zootermopsis nevadensis]KDR14088.1 Matrix metalloproteinase-14 [Zootermopsis nevadensis]